MDHKKKTKIFLGNSGSYMLGFLHAYILIYFFMNSKFHPMIMAWSLASIFFEFLSTNLIRISNNKSFLVAGKDHILYIVRNSKNKYYVVFILSLFNLFTILFGFFITNQSNNFSILFFIMYGVFYFFKKKKFFIIKILDMKYRLAI